MDASTYSIRKANWSEIIQLCQERPAGTTAKQWLADNSIPEGAYYYWQRKLRQETFDQLNVPAVQESTELSFAEVPVTSLNNLYPSEPKAVSTLVIKKNDVSFEMTNEISPDLLACIIKEVCHA